MGSEVPYSKCAAQHRETAVNLSVEVEGGAALIEQAVAGLHGSGGAGSKAAG